MAATKAVEVEAFDYDSLFEDEENEKEDGAETQK